MEIIYRAYDGQEFSTEEECINHEKNADFIMYDNNGRIYCVEDTMVVCFKNSNGISDFVRLNEERDLSHDGLDENDYYSSSEFPLWFYWNEETDSFEKIPNSVVQVIKIS